MKIRTDFVTNSSSSSFIIAKKYLDKDQIEAIEDHFYLASQMGMINPNDRYMFSWSIQQNDDFIAGDVDMDNFSMSEFLERIGVPSRRITWGEYPFNLDEEAEEVEEFLEEDEDWRKLLHESKD